MASESGSSTDSHVENPESKDGKVSSIYLIYWVGHCIQQILIFIIHLVKKKSGAGLKLSTLMNIGKKKILSLEGPEKSVETSGKFMQTCCRSSVSSTVKLFTNKHFHILLYNRLSECPGKQPVANTLVSDKEW